MQVELKWDMQTECNMLFVNGVNLYKDKKDGIDVKRLLNAFISTSASEPN